jgi:2-polyprenyl-3-methyl-5-hydroxy-6-metoxy-1,4-benzoquinol methylase
MTLHNNLKDAEGYLSRMAASVREKARIADYIDPLTTAILDVGCADGAITRVLAEALPNATVLGIDLDESFVLRAKEQHGALSPRLQFESTYLRDMLARDTRFDVVSFVSVLHEFYSYGEGTSSVLKALADAHELLHTGGEIIIRDMVPMTYAKQNHSGATSAILKVRSAPQHAQQLTDFEAHYGELTTTFDLNHFLLKYFYTDNWQHECAEHYMPMTIEQYEQMFKLLDMELVHRETYRLPYLEGKWRTDFGLTDTELSDLITTTILVARKA